MSNDNHIGSDEIAARGIMRALGLRVRDRAEWRHESARRARVRNRALIEQRAQSEVEQFATRLVTGRAALDAVRAALDAVQVRARERTISLDEVVQAIDEACDADDDGQGYSQAAHSVAGSYGYPVSYTYARAAWCRSGVLVVIGRRASAQRDRYVLLSHPTARTLARRAQQRRLAEAGQELATALAQIPDHELVVTHEDSLAAGNCAKITARAVSDLGSSAKADDVVRWTVAHGIAVSYALRAIATAQRRMERGPAIVRAS